MRRVTFLLLGALIFLLMGCVSAPVEENNKPMVMVSIQPQRFFVEAIADTLVDVDVVIPAGASPATFEPNPETMRSLAKADAYIAIGHVVFEKSWGEHFRQQNPEMEWVDQSVAVEPISGGHEHAHGHNHNHEHTRAIDPHIWTSPKSMKKQLPIILAAMKDILPEYEQQLDANYDILFQRVDSLDRAFEQQLANMSSRKFMIFHPAYTYLARDYGLQQLSIEFEGKEPTPGHLKDIVQQGRQYGIRHVLIQREFPREKAEVVARELQAEVVVVEPLAYNWFAGMEHVLLELSNN